MVRSTLSTRVWKLFEQEAYDEARRLLEMERNHAPDDHWILTQLAVTFYEQRQYEESLQLLLAAREIVPDCPLTNWNLAGTLGALGKHEEAIQLYTWLLARKR